MCVGDVVLIKNDEDLPCNQWQPSRALAHVRTVKLAVADRPVNSWNAPFRSLCCYLKQVRPEVHPRRGATIASSISSS